MRRGRLGARQGSPSPHLPPTVTLAPLCPSPSLVDPWPRRLRRVRPGRSMSASATTPLPRVGSTPPAALRSPPRARPDSRWTGYPTAGPRPLAAP
eukprot:scaffold129854_cov48-Phaeocystis_antarctica.AAC.2